MKAHSGPIGRGAEAPCKDFSTGTVFAQRQHGYSLQMDQSPSCCSLGRLDSSTDPGAQWTERPMAVEVYVQYWYSHPSANDITQMLYPL
jgi:hypothetical protein